MQFLKQPGIITHNGLHDLIDQGVIECPGRDLHAQVNPASINVTLQGKFLVEEWVVIPDRVVFAERTSPAMVPSKHKSHVRLSHGEFCLAAIQEKLNLPNRGPSSSASDLPSTHSPPVARHRAAKPMRLPSRSRRDGETSPQYRGDNAASARHSMVLPAPRSPVRISARAMRPSVGRIACIVEHRCARCSRGAARAGVRS